MFFGGAARPGKSSKLNFATLREHFSAAEDFGYASFVPGAFLLKAELEKVRGRESLRMQTKMNVKLKDV